MTSPNCEKKPRRNSLLLRSSGNPINLIDVDSVVTVASCENGVLLGLAAIAGTIAVLGFDVVVGGWKIVETAGIKYQTMNVIVALTCGQKH